MDKKSSEKRKAPSLSSNETIDNITNQTKGLFEDLTSWMELKIQYVILDYQEQFTQKAKGIAFEITALVILGIGVLFGLVALALGLGTLLNHPGWGFLIVMGLLFLAAMVVRAVGKGVGAPKKQGKDAQNIDITEEKPKLTSPKVPEQLSTQNGKG